MTLDQVKRIVADSQFPPDFKRRLGLILPNLDKYILTGLGREVSRGDSLPIAASLVEKWENFARILDGLRKSDSRAVQDFFKLLREIGDPVINEEEKLFFLSLVLDARSLAGASKLDILPQEYENILDYEISLFWHLPKEEIMFLLQNRLLFLESKINLLNHMQVVTWEHDWDYASNFSKAFSDLLYQNKEMFGAGAPKEVGVWIKEFFNFSSPTFSQATVVGVAEFLVKDPFVQKLTGAERKTLSEILKLFIWFLEPQINETEVLGYKEEMRLKEAELAEKEAKSATGGLVAAPTIPKGPLAGAQRPMSDVKTTDAQIKTDYADAKKSKFEDRQSQTGRGENGNGPGQDRGLKFGQVQEKIPNQKPMPPVPPGGSMKYEVRSMDRQVEIDRKLEELKNRSKKKEL